MDCEAILAFHSQHRGKALFRTPHKEEEISDVGTYKVSVGCKISSV